MYLTRMRFSRPLPRDTQAIHRTVAWALEGVPGRVLWAAPTSDLLVVQAPAPVPRRAFRGVVEHAAGPVVYPETGQQVMCSLIANPVVCRDGKRRPVPVERRAAWLERKLDGAVDLDTVEVQAVGTRAGWRRCTQVTHYLVAYAAAGTVVDADRLREIMDAGVGPGKAYGAGLLLVGAR